MRRAALAAALLAAPLLMSLTGCATVPPPAPPAPRAAPPAVATPPPTPGAEVGTTASGGRITVHEPATPGPAVVDSTPSAEALAVLRSIPDPDGTSGLPDTVRVPVPAPTEPLGERPGARVIAAPPESLAAPVTPALPAPSAPPAAPPAAPDSCWRVQVAAPPERERADRMAEAARSQLIVPFVIEREGGLHKVRTRDCLSAAAAADLRRRAVESGFDGAFRFLRKTR